MADAFTETLKTIAGSLTIGGVSHDLTFVQVPGIKKPVLRSYDNPKKDPKLELPFVFEDTALRQVHVATALSTVDGEGDGHEGTLLYRGHNIKDLVAKTSYEEVAHLLLVGMLPDKDQLAAFKKDLAKQAVLDEGVQKQLVGALNAIEVRKDTDPTSLMSTLIAIMDAHEKLPLKGEDARYASDLRTIAVMPTLIGLVNARLQAGDKPSAMEYHFHEESDFGEKGQDFSLAKLTMQALHQQTAAAGKGKEFAPLDEKKVAALDKYLILHAEHGLNLSTATARAVDSGEAREGAWRITLGALQSLAGNRHGNASNDALSNLKTILQYNGGQGSIEDRVDAYIRDVELAKAAKDRKEEYRGQLGQLMDGTVEGQGHKVYTSTDPRASTIKRILEESGVESDLLKVALNLEVKLAVHPLFGKKAEATGGKAKNILANTDFFAGVLLSEELGIDEKLMTSMFAVGRNVGWQAHAAEAARNAGSIARPEAIALTPEAPVLRIEDRTPPTQVTNARTTPLFKLFKTIGLAAA